MSSFNPRVAILAPLVLFTAAFPLQLRCATPPPPEFAIPGPLPPFLRLAAVSHMAPPEQVLPLLAHQVVLDGYSGRARSLAPTEYLVLVKRYVNQARELQSLAGRDGNIRVANCHDAPRLLAVIGYKLEQPCGPTTRLAATDPKRAFTAIDSGFPLGALEKALQDGNPFVFPYSNARLPVLFDAGVWMRNDHNRAHRDLLDALLGDPELARLYWALAQIDEQTRGSLRENPGIEKLLPLAALLDFYGQQLRIRAGVVQVPGGPAAEPAWENLVGVSPHSPGEFVLALLSKDGGWMAPLYDALCRVSGPRQAYFTNPQQLAAFYQALRGRDTNPSPAKSVFRPDPGLALLVTQTPLDTNGQPHVPGNLRVWAEVLRNDNESKAARDWSKRSNTFSTPDQLIEFLIALSRTYSPRGPLQNYLALCEIDHDRSTPLSSQTASLLARNYRKLNDQYLVFSEFRTLNDTSIADFVNDALAVDQISDLTLRAEAIGMLQAQSGIWQILARQGEIFPDDMNSSWQRVLHPFASVHTAPELYDATRLSLGELVRAATGQTRVTQNELIELLAGPKPTSEHRGEVREDIANRMRAVLEAQRLVSLDTLLALGDGLPQVAVGKATTESLVPLAKELREFEMPKPIFSTGEKTEWTMSRFGDAHTQAEMDTNIIEALHARGAAKAVADARGRLVPFVRDFLVGLNYAYYEPPGAQMLHNNPLFIRRHDFSGDIENGSEPSWVTPELVGRGDTSAGGVRLSGGLAELPYILAQVEQEFLVPKNVQALIWEDLVPSLMSDSVVPRWWQVTPNELHAVALYQESAEELLGAAGQNAELRTKVLSILSNRMLSRRLAELEASLNAGRGDDFARRLTPAEAFYLGTEFHRLNPAEITGKAGQELASLTRDDPNGTNPQKLSQDFGIPHPLLAQSNQLELLNVKPFPTFFGYSSALLAESWESNNLYWARLADEKGLPPESLQQLVPMLTWHMVENIFATDLDDWPALLRALLETGEEFREGKLQPITTTNAAS